MARDCAAFVSATPVYCTHHAQTHHGTWPAQVVFDIYLISEAARTRNAYMTHSSLETSFDVEAFKEQVGVLTVLLYWLYC